MYNNRVLLVKTELGLPLNSTFSLYRGDLLFCKRNNDWFSDYYVDEFIYNFNNKEILMKLNIDNDVLYNRVSHLFNQEDLIPIQVLLRDGQLEDVTRDYKIKKILEK